MKGFEQLMHELEEWYPKSEMSDAVALVVHQKIAEQKGLYASLAPKLVQQQITDSISDEQCRRDHHYIERMQQILRLRSAFEGAEYLHQIPDETRILAERIFTGVFVRQISKAFPEKYRPYPFVTQTPQEHMLSIYEYAGALIALSCKRSAVSAHYPFDF